MTNSTIMNSFLKWVLIVLFPLSASAECEVMMQQEVGGNQHIAIEADGLPIDCTFDTGCSSLTVSKAVFDELVRRGSVSEEDLYDEGVAEMANGEKYQMRGFVIHRLKIGDCVLRDIPASIGINHHSDAPSLFGQTVLERFATYTVTGNKLIFEPRPATEQQALITAYRLQNDTTSSAREQIIEVLSPYIDRLSPRYLMLYVSALDESGRHEEAQRIYQQLVASGVYYQP